MNGEQADRQRRVMMRQQLRQWAETLDGLTGTVEVWGTPIQPTLEQMVADMQHLAATVEIPVVDHPPGTYYVCFVVGTPKHPDVPGSTFPATRILTTFHASNGSITDQAAAYAKERGQELLGILAMIDPEALGLFLQMSSTWERTGIW